MEREQDFPAERALQAFTKLGKALELYAHQLESHATTVMRAVDDVERVNALGEAEKTSKKSEDPASFQAQRARYERQQSEFQQVSTLLANTGGVLFSGSVGAEGAKAASESARIRKDLVDVQEAFDRGLIDLKETERALKKLNHQLALSQGKEAVAGAGDQGKSRWSKLAQSAVPGMVEATQKGVQALVGQVAGVGSGLMGTLSSALPAAGGLALFGLLLWGFKEADRIRAEFGELANIAVAAGGNAHSRGLAWMGGFQERAQKFYGIARHEVQGVFKDFVNAGISMDDMFRTYDKSLGEVGQNAITVSLAADRHFELSAGTTSRAATQAVSQYGMELGKAADLITNIEFQAHHAGFGVGRLVSWTLQATANVRHLGIGVEEVASAAFSMRKFYEKAGVDSENWSKDSVSEMLSGIQGMGVGREIWAAEKLGLGKDIQGRQALREGLMRRDPMMLRKLATVYKRDAEKAGGGNESIARFYLEKQGMGFEGAKAVMTLGDETENDAKVHDKKKDDRKVLRNAFREESMKVSELTKRKNEMLAGFATAGQGLMQMLTGFMALVIVSVKGLPYYFLGSPDEAAKARSMMEQQIDAIAGGAKMFLIGGEQALGAIWKTIGPMIEPMLRAWDFVPPQHLTKEEQAMLDEADPVKRRDNQIKLLARYGMATPENVRAIYNMSKGAVTDLTTTPIPFIPKKPSTGTGATVRPVAPGKPASEVPPAAAPPPRAPILIEVGGKVIQLGSLGPPALKTRRRIEVHWNADPDETNLVAEVTLTKEV